MMIRAHLLELKKITDAMVIDGRITASEQIDFLEKAGLTKVSDREWVDSADSKYSFL